MNHLVNLHMHIGTVVKYPNSKQFTDTNTHPGAEGDLMLKHSFISL